MNIKIINAIKSEMQIFLSNEQMDKIDEVLNNLLYYHLNCKSFVKDQKNLIKKFILSKEIEGCSKRTEEYYGAVLSFFEKHIKKVLFVLLKLSK